MSLGRAASQLRAELRAERYELALDAQGLARSSFLSWLSGAPRRVVLRPRECARLLATEAVPARDRLRPGDEYRDLLRAVGATSQWPQARMRLPPLDPERRAADALLDGTLGTATGDAGRPLVALIPCTTRPQKHWFDDRWAELGATYAERGCDVVVLGGPSDQSRCEAIVEQARARAKGLAPATPAPGGDIRIRSLAGKTSLRVAAGVLGRARVAIGVDTGLTHLSMANDTPTVALLGSAYPYLHALPGSMVLREPMACAPCDRRPTCGGRFDCMRALTVDRVAAAVQSISGL